MPLKLQSIWYFIHFIHFFNFDMDIKWLKVSGMTTGTVHSLNAHCTVLPCVKGWPNNQAVYLNAVKMAFGSNNCIPMTLIMWVNVFNETW